MKTPSLTIFANFFIDNEERFQRMKNSFYSFRNSNPDQWLINIRGSLKFQAGQFLKKELHNKIILFNLESRQGWFHDTKIITSHINTNYLFIWTEDHILIGDSGDLNNCVIEMEKFKVDQLIYSFFTNEMKERYAILPIYKKGKFITVTKIDYDACLKIRNKLKKDFYIISLLSIMRSEYFVKVINSSKPYLKRWPRHLPFDFEKKSNDRVFSLIWHALPNKELFVSIDDDRDQDGYSLISRGIYKSSIPKYDIKEIEYLRSSLLTKKIKSVFPEFLFPFVSIMLNFLRRMIYTINTFYNKRFD